MLWHRIRSLTVKRLPIKKSEYFCQATPFPWCINTACETMMQCYLLHKNIKNQQQRVLFLKQSEEKRQSLTIEDCWRDLTGSIRFHSRGVCVNHVVLFCSIWISHDGCWAFTELSWPASTKKGVDLSLWFLKCANPAATLDKHCRRMINTIASMHLEIIITSCQEQM